MLVYRLLATSLSSAFSNLSRYYYAPNRHQVYLHLCGLRVVAGSGKSTLVAHPISWWYIPGRTTGNNNRCYKPGTTILATAAAHLRIIVLYPSCLGERIRQIKVVHSDWTNLTGRK